MWAPQTTISQFQAADFDVSKTGAVVRFYGCLDLRRWRLTVPDTGETLERLDELTVDEDRVQR